MSWTDRNPVRRPCEPRLELVCHVQLEAISFDVGTLLMLSPSDSRGGGEGTFKWNAFLRGGQLRFGLSPVVEPPHHGIEDRRQEDAEERHPDHAGEDRRAQ